MSKKQRDPNIAQAFIYIEAIAKQSELFQEKLEECRKKHSLRFTDLEKIDLWVGGKYKEYEHLYKEGDFQEILDFFYIPKGFKEGLLYLLLTERRDKFLPSRSSIEIFTPNGKEEVIQNIKSFVPHIRIQAPLFLKKEELLGFWEKIVEMKKDHPVIGNSFSFFKEIGWKDGTSFDNALRMYHFHSEGYKGKKLLEKMKEEGMIWDINEYSDRNSDFLRTIKKIGNQIEGLRRYKEA